ncbi:amidase [Bradyrhizobium sp.]|uniref:amidase n=1 Tax=Bradyrhizobium sp. TaxID=376 RepID=UPI0039E34BB9
MLDPLSRLSATEVVGLLRAGEVSPVELVDIALRRIAEVEPLINALPIVCSDRARERARAIADSRGGEDKSPHYLWGIPIAVKDNVDVEGVRTTHGSMIYKNRVSARSDIVVETLERNGAIVIAKSNLPEFAAGGNTFNDVFGATLNPWNRRLTAGGSSGGSAAALAAGEVWLATGNDLAGSIRVPASFCSVVGLRPSPGRVARGPRKQMFSQLSVEGPMARCVADVALMLDAQSDYSPSDPISLPKPDIPFVRCLGRPINGRIAFSEDLGIVPVDAEVAGICRSALAGLSDLGMIVEEARPDLSDAEQIFQVLRSALFVGRVGHLLEKHSAEINPDVVANAQMGLSLEMADLSAAEEARDALYARMVQFFTRYDFLVCPTSPLQPFDVDLRYPGELMGRPFHSYVGWMALTFAITVASCPSISLPCGFTRTGAPVGIQIVAAPRSEGRLLTMADALEQRLDLKRRVPIEPMGDPKRV